MSKNEDSQINHFENKNYNEHDSFSNDNDYSEIKNEIDKIIDHKSSNSLEEDTLSNYQTNQTNNNNNYYNSNINEKPKNYIRNKSQNPTKLKINNQFNNIYPNQNNFFLNYNNFSPINYSNNLNLYNLSPLYNNNNINFNMMYPSNFFKNYNFMGINNNFNNYNIFNNNINKFNNNNNNKINDKQNNQNKNINQQNNIKTYNNMINHNNKNNKNLFNTNNNNININNIKNNNNNNNNNNKNNNNNNNNNKTNQNSKQIKNYRWSTQYSTNFQLSTLQNNNIKKSKTNNYVLISNNMLKRKSIHSQVDEEYNKIIIDNILNHTDLRTTLMIKNIPNKYTINTFLDEINVLFKNKYDLFYLPIDYNNKCNLGFAFINFVNSFYIIEFYNLYIGKKWKYFNSEKKCDLLYAKIQGKRDLIKHFEKGKILSLDSEDKKPLILPTPINFPKIKIPIEYLNFFIKIYPFSIISFENNYVNNFNFQKYFIIEKF